MNKARLVLVVDVPVDKTREFPTVEHFVESEQRNLHSLGGKLLWWKCTDGPSSPVELLLHFIGDTLFWGDSEEEKDWETVILRKDVE